MRVNLNALGDRVVYFAVLALSVSPNGSMVAACTDRSRVIVLQVPQRQIRTTKSQNSQKTIENMGHGQPLLASFSVWHQARSSRQLRNLYGASVNDAHSKDL